MAAAALTAPPVAHAGPRWIIGRGVDLSLVIGSSAAGYAYLLLYAAMHVPITLSLVVLVGWARRHSHLRHCLANLLR